MSDEPSAGFHTMETLVGGPLPGCPVCGGKLTEIRGKHPGMPPRNVCATCLQERMDTIHDMSRYDYGVAYTDTANTAFRVRRTVAPERSVGQEVHH